MEYSISIRTLGNISKALLRSIERQTVQPKEINIILPEGYSLPDNLLGNERIVFADKGMLSQRIKSIEVASTEYVLLLDDDVELEERFVEKMLQTFEEKDADILFPQWRQTFPQGVRIFTEAVLARAIPIRHKDYYVKIIASSGYTYNRNCDDCNEILKSESANGMCLFVRKKAIDKIDYKKELWVDVNSYSYLEDAVLVYKAYLNSLSIYAVPNLQIKDLGKYKRATKERRRRAAYSEPHNCIMFFYRLILRNKKNKIISYLIFSYWLISNFLFSLLRSIVHRMPIFYYFLKGIKDGYYRSKSINDS